MFPTLFSKVMLLLTCCLGVSCLGVLVGRNIRSMVAFIVLLIAFIGGAIVVMLASNAAPPVAIGLLMGWTFISGLFLGPCMQAYSEELGWQTVFLCFLGTAGACAVSGMVGMLSGIDFSVLSSYLAVGLFGLIIFGIIGIFVRMSRTVNIVHGIIGMVIFTGYFLVDFFRITRGENTWGEGVRVSMSLYLDFVNFLLYLLQVVAASHK